MKMLVAIAIIALAALAAPLAVGQSQALRLDAVGELATGAVQVVQSGTTAFRAPSLGSSAAAIESADASRAAPDSVVTWLIAFVFLVLVVARRTRSSFMR